MNPESRIKLIRSLEEIKDFERKNFETSRWKSSAWGGIIFYMTIILVNFFRGINRPELFHINILFVLLPIPLSSAWLIIRHKFNKKYQLLASAILEIGSIAQESHISEIAPQNFESKVIKPTKPIIKRKKK